MQLTERIRAQRRRSVWIALGAIVALGIALRLVHFDDVASYSPDERVYAEIAGRIADQGFAAMPQVFAEYEHDSLRWSFPSPTRVGHLFFVAAAMKISGIRDERAGAAVSFIFSCLSLFLLAWIGVRFFGAGVALSAVFFLAVSVSELAMSRRAWQDGVFGFFGLLLLYLMCEIVRNPRKLILYPLFCAAGVLNLLTKQTGVLSYGVCGLFLVAFLLFHERWVKGAFLLILGGVASVLVTIAIWGLLAGGVGIALSAFNHSLHPGIEGISYLQACCTGPWYQFPYLLWIMGPLPTALALFGAAVSLAPKELFARLLGPESALNVNCARAVLCMTFGLVAFSSFFPGMQSLRYISPADGAFVLLAGIGLWGLLSAAHRVVSRADYRLLLALSIVVLLIEGARDYRTFTSVVVSSGMQDLAVTDIRRVMDR